MIAAIAETNRVPFDLPEAETELVAGFHTEYSAMKFALFFLAEYINMFTVSMLATTLFLGGWNVPFAEDIFGRGTFLFGLVSAIGFLLKVIFILFLYIWLRGTLPRFRFDQLMNFGWKFLLPLALLNIFITATLIFLFPKFLMLALLFILFGALAIGCALAVVAQRNPLYSAISLIGVFISLACLYVMLAAPFIAAVQVIVYAGAIMVLVVFVIMLLNVEQEERRRTRLRFLVPTAVGLAAVLIAEVAFILVTVQEFSPSGKPSNVGLTHSIGTALFTRYLLPFEITSILLLMAIVGAMTLARRGGMLSPGARVIPSSQTFPLSMVDPGARPDDLRAVETETTADAARLLGLDAARDQSKRD